MVSRNWEVVLLTRDAALGLPNDKKTLGQNQFRQQIVGQLAPKTHIESVGKAGGILITRQNELARKILVVFNRQVPSDEILALDQPTLLDRAMDELRQVATRTASKGLGSGFGKMIFRLPPLGLASINGFGGIHQINDNQNEPIIYQDYQVGKVILEITLPTMGKDYRSLKLVVEARRQPDGKRQLWVGFLDFKNPNPQNVALPVKLVSISRLWSATVDCQEVNGWLVCFDLEPDEWRLLISAGNSAPYPLEIIL